MSIITNKRGLTVIEVLVTVLIVTIIFGMVVSIIGFFSRFYNDENQHINRQENMRLLMLQLERDIRMSDQEVDFGNTPCYVIGTGLSSTPVHTYCFFGEDDSDINKRNTVERNGVIVARNVQGFTLSITTDSRTLVISILMIPDTRNKQLEANYTIFLRQAAP